jgi:hypothetical protein
MAKDREKFKKDLDASTKKKIEENIQKKISLAKELAKKIASNPDLKKSYVELSVNLNIVINASSNRASNFDIELIKTEILNRNFSSRGSVEQQQEKSTRSIPVFQRYLLGI